MRRPFEDLPARARARVRHADAATRRRVVALAVLAALAFALSLVVQLQLVPLHSDDRDEGVYIFQAQMLREGMLTLPADEYGEFFRPWLSGEADGRIFTEYQVGFPLFLALADLLLGSMRIGLALVAALTVPAGYAFAHRMLGDRRAALWAAGLVALSPMTVLLSGLFVTYSLTVLLLFAASWALLVAADRSSWRAALGSGVLTGAALLVRPMDVVLFMPPVVALALYRLVRREHVAVSGVVRLGAAALLGVVPAGVLTLLYNAGTTGHPLRFPNMAADELNTFGFGTRRLVETEPTIEYGVRDALRALWENVSAVPSWLPGGIALVALAVVGLVVGGRRGGRLAERATLVALVAAFPAGYLFWWATALSAEGAVNGIGPHYYVPAMAALCLLGARGVVALVPARLVPVAAVVVGLAAVTAWAVPDKVEDKRRVTRSFEQVADAIPDDLTNAVVVVDYDGRPYVMSKYPFLRNDPRLEGDVLFAADRGPRNTELFERFPDRDIHFVRAAMRPGDPLFEPSASFDELTRDEGERLSLRVTASGLPTGRHVRAVIWLDDGRRIWNLHTVGEGTLGEPHDAVDLGTSDESLDTAAWELVAPGAPRAGAAANGVDGVVELRGPTSVLIGVLHSPHADLRDAEWKLEEHSVDVRDGRLVLTRPPRGHALARFATATVYLPEAIGTKLTVDADVTG